MSISAQSDSDIEETVKSLYERGAWAEAARTAAWALPPRSADLGFYHGLALARLGRFDDAARVFRQAWRSYPGDARFPTELAGVAWSQQRPSDAKHLLAAALRLSPSDAYGNEFLATLYLTEGNLSAALKYLNRIHKPLIGELRFDPPPPILPLLRDRAFAVSAGQVFTTEQLRTTEANLRRLGLFAYRFDLTPAQDHRFELTYHSFDGIQPFRGWPGRVIPFARGLPYQTLFIDFPNLRQSAISLTSLARWDPDKRRLAVSLAAPIHLNPRYRYRFAIDIRDENWDLRTTYYGVAGEIDGLQLRKIEAGGEFTAAVTSRLEWTSGLWVAHRQFQNSSPDRAFANGSSFQLQNRLAYSRMLMPERRLYTNAAASLRAGRVVTGAPRRIVTAEGAANIVWLPQSKGDNLTISLGMNAGKAFGAPPFDELTMLGMERDNDLWLRGHVGTRDGRKGSAPLGTHYALFRADLSHTICQLFIFRFQAGPFFDVGRISDPSGNFGSRGWMYDVGLQAKVRAPGGITVTLIYGRDLRGGRGVFYTRVIDSGSLLN